MKAGESPEGLGRGALWEGGVAAVLPGRGLVSRGLGLGHHQLPPTKARKPTTAASILWA